MTPSGALETVAAIAQIGFYAVVATVTILTYRQARRTLFQPVRTEIFKEQLKELSQVLSPFVGKGEVDLREFSGLELAFSCNAHFMYDNYTECFFDRPPIRKGEPYASCRTSEMSKDDFLKHFALVDEDSERVAVEHNAPPDPRVRAALWADYEHCEIILPDRLVEARDQIDVLLRSPLLPSPVLDALEAVRRTVNENVKLIGKTLTVAAKEMPSRYPTKKSIGKASFSWVANRYRDSFKDLEPAVEALLKTIREYYTPDGLTTDRARAG